MARRFVDRRAGRNGITRDWRRSDRKHVGRCTAFAQPSMLQCNASVVLGNVGTTDDLALLAATCLHEHRVVRDRAVWAVSALRRATPVAETDG